MVTVKKLLLLLLCIALSISLLACGPTEEPEEEPNGPPGEVPDDGNDDTPPHTHSYDDAWLKNYSGHWQFCACGEKSETQPHDMSDWEFINSDEEKNYYSRKCSVCGYTENKSELIPPHECIFGEEWVINGIRHWHECECGKTADGESHEYTDWEIRSNEDGRYYYRECKDCHHSQSEPCFDNIDQDDQPTNPDSPPNDEFDLPEIDMG